MANGLNPPDLTSDVGTTRILIPDLSLDEAEDYLFSDGELSSLLALYGGSVRRAAAAALDALAVNEALLYKYVRTDDQTVDGTKGAEVLRKRANSLRAEADAQDALELEEAFQVVYPELGYFVPEATPGVWGRWGLWG